MNFYVYVIESKESGKYYVGQTNDVSGRLTRHREGKTSFGKRNKDLFIAYKKEFATRNEAVQAEAFIKRQKSRVFINKLVKGEYTIPP